MKRPRCALVALVLLFGPGCGRVFFELQQPVAGDSSGPDDGGLQPAGDAEAGMDPDVGVDVTLLSTEPFEQVRRIDTLSTASDEDDPTLPADQLEIVFARFEVDSEDLWLARRTSVDDDFGAPVALAALNSTARETAPWMSSDGLRLLFRSTRNGSDQFFVSTRETRRAEWSSPLLLADMPADLAGTLCESDDGLRRVVSAFEEPGHLVELTRPDLASDFGAPRRLEELDMMTGEREPQLLANGHILLFSSRGDLATGSKDLYAAFRADLDEPFDAPRLLESVNTELDESDPWLSEDQRTLFFTREGDVYEAHR